jgi:chromosome segregation ATPase
MEYITSSRLGKSLGSKVGGKVLTPDLHAEIKEISSKLHNTAKKVSEMEKFLELEKTRKVVEYSKRAFYQDMMLGVTAAAATTASVIAYENFKVNTENQVLKTENQVLKKRISELTEAAVRKHDGDLALKKSSSQSTNLSRESIQSSLDSDIERVLESCNGMPINGNCALYEKKV